MAAMAGKEETRKRLRSGKSVSAHDKDGDDEQRQLDVFFCFQGESFRRNGRSLWMTISDADFEKRCVGVEQIRNALRGYALQEGSNGARGILSGKFELRWYCSELRGWQKLGAESGTITGEIKGDRLRVMLRADFLSDVSSLPHLPCQFMIGIVGAKTRHNFANLNLSARQFGAAGTFLLQPRFSVTAEETAGTFHSTFDAFGELLSALPHAYALVAVEMGGEPLDTFEHPARALYLLGAEDNGLPSNIRAMCRHTVSLPSVRSASFNVTVAGSIIMYDRFCKMDT